MAPTAQFPARIAELQTLLATDGAEAVVDLLVALGEQTRGAWGFGEPSVRDVLSASPGRRRAALLRLLLDRARTARTAASADHLYELAEWLAHGLSLPDRAEELALVLDVAGQRWTCHDPDLIGTAWDLLDRGRPLPADFLATLRRTVAGTYHTKVFAALLAKVPAPPLLNLGEAWADRVLADVAELGQPWHDLVAHAATATPTKITKAFEKRGRALLDTVGADKAADVLGGWLTLVGRSRTRPLVRRHYDGDVNELYDPVNATTLRGLIWLAGLLPPRPETARLLGAVVETSLRKAAGVGPRSPKIANTAVHTLARLESDEALAQIARLAARVTYKGTLKELNTALDTRAQALGLSRAEVEELAVPAYGLTEVGRRVDHFGEVRAETVVGAGGVHTSWHTAAGRVVKSAPAAVRRDHAEQLRELKAAGKDIEQMLAAQAERLDRQFLARRSWAYPAWRARYLDHPLLGTLARRLIWVIGEQQAVAWSAAGLTTLDGTVAEPEPDATVRLWHPIGRPVDEVLAWRERLERDQVVQPFKQAHREVYLLTAAEENTRTYSNRYAAHVLRQHQFHALAAARGWRNRLRLMVDDEYPPATRELPEWGLRAEFWVEGAGHEYGADTTDSGAYLHLATDQVRFYALDAPGHSAHAGGGGYHRSWRDRPADGIPLDQVPPLAFSEVMRDVDLFVGVASVGNDPTWQDGGPEGRFLDYWTSYSFGELTATAQTRRDLLRRLVPRLAIADRATVEDRFLVVRGDLRTYRIHLGSGNILMSPNDQYLCIVASQSAAAGTGGVFLPFEGDRVLAVILSKAMLLARDSAITDPTITRQIQR
ncbi:DUF4132 domain-containing protein [Catellatospora sp. NPDC049609]|uniref:DUF4132 domain-containing protein n=1 Tax=Catellatospora sp. NPDC049609 TaxID=3155505 RepID=UPI003433E73C